MNEAFHALLQALREPRAMASLSEADWDRVLRQADAAGLLGRIGADAQAAGLLPGLPPIARRRMLAHLTVAAQQQRAVRWELTLLSRTLAGIDGPIVVLKGGAYAAAGLAPAPGRLFSDIDLMVPRTQIDAAEAALMLDGWITSHHDAYDQRYYRDWMHELPPMTQVRRRTVLDLHHSILPRTARLQTPPEPLFAAARPLPGFPRFHMLDAADLVLHSATHLFHEGEWQHGLRDLVDLDALLKSGSAADAGFWPHLAERARVLNLSRPLGYALRLCAELLGTPQPVSLALADAVTGWRGAAMHALFRRALSRAHPPSQQPAAAFAETLLYIRSHWLRMPPQLLLPHLLRKAWLRRFPAAQPGAPGEPVDIAAAVADDAEPAGR
ncbi:nucleotidyltransferase family protein [Aquincola sp. S2]|uniref:Nucleotidyltransferase family protein n=1 Tax=Pseudaquabacterium terrae TaxID=2732868 RepID=A0ABX2EC94_9BURK|nr:nucleotidyltransferase family protein [Aquabacterium terrae]NRF66540.1 nucleotidyltransferase family protein [Aquabacterium terrae]